MFADLNFDDTVDELDYLLFVEGHNTRFDENTTALDKYIRGDLNADDQQDIFDALEFIRAFDAANGAGASASVPEPNTVALLFVALAGLFVNRRRVTRSLVLVIACGAMMLLPIHSAQAGDGLEGLLAEYTFNGNMDDTSGNGRHLVPNPGATFGEEPFVTDDFTISFGGDINEYAEIPCTRQFVRRLA